MTRMWKFPSLEKEIYAPGTSEFGGQYDHSPSNISLRPASSVTSRGSDTSSWKATRRFRSTTRATRAATSARLIHFSGRQEPRLSEPVTMPMR